MHAEDMCIHAIYSGLWCVLAVCCWEPGAYFSGCSRTRRVSDREWSRDLCSAPRNPQRGPSGELWLPSLLPSINYNTHTVFNNSMQVVFHQLLFWFGSYGRNVSGFLAGISRAGDLLLLCNVTFQSVLGTKIMECHLLSFLNFKGMHLVCGRNIWGETWPDSA